MNNTKKLEWILAAHRAAALDNRVESCSDIGGPTGNPSFSIRHKGVNRKIQFCENADPQEHVKSMLSEKLESFAQFVTVKESADDAAIPTFSKFKFGGHSAISYLNEDENIQVDNAVAMFESECDSKLSNIDEGFLGKLAGGAAGFIVGPMIGRIIANALGIEKGIIYDMLTSRLVTTALGVAIAKYLGGDYKSN